MPKEPASSVDTETLTKGQFAKLIGVSPGRVSQYISEGKLGPDCLEGQGRSAKIKVSKAKAALSDKLDISQRLGNGLKTDLGDGKDAPTAPSSNPPVEPRFEDQIKQEKLLKMQRDNRRAAEEDALRAGQLVHADAAREQATNIANRMMQTFDGSISDLASAVASHFKLPHRDVVHCMRLAYAGTRERAHGQMSEEAESMPAVVESVLTQDMPLQ